MKPPRFEYHDPTTVEEALSLLEEHGDDGKILAGGQSLVPMLNMRLARPEVIVDVNRISDLSYVREGDAGDLCIGTLARHTVLERSELVVRKLPILQEAARYIGHTAIRTRGTVGGSIVHADPAAELPGVLVALDGEIVLRGPDGERVVSPDEFFIGYLMTSIEPTEMVVEIRFPSVPRGTGYAFMEVARRHGDFALVGVAALLGLQDSGKIGLVRIGIIGAGPAALRGTEAEALLIGESPSADLFRAAGEAISTSVEPDGDIHATEQYRREVAGVLVRRALTTALERCGPAG